MRECVDDVSPSVDDGAEGGKKGFLSLFGPVLTGFSAGCVGALGRGFCGCCCCGCCGATSFSTGGGVANGSEVIAVPAVLVGDFRLLNRAARVQGLINPSTVSSAGK